MTDIRIDIDTQANTRPVDEVTGALKRIEHGLAETSKAAQETSKHTTFLTQILRECAMKGWALAVDFMRQSVDAALENEAALRKLRSVAGDLTDGLARQADAFQMELGVSGEMVMGMQELAIRFGVASDKLNPLIQATLDYAAKTGTDATSALRKFLISVDNGGAGLARMGVTYKSTGDYGKDLDEVTKQLTERWGGSAKTAAESLEGQAHALGMAWGEVKESFGGFLLKVAEGVGLTQKMKEMARSLNEVTMDTNTANQEATVRQEQLNLAKAKMGTILKYVDGQTKKLAAEGMTALQIAENEDLRQGKEMIAQLQAEIDAIERKKTAIKTTAEAEAVAAAAAATQGKGKTAKQLEEEAKAREKHAKEWAASVEKAQKEVNAALLEGGEMQDKAREEQGRKDDEAYDKEQAELKDSQEKVRQWEAEGAEALAEQQDEARSEEARKQLEAYEKSEQLANEHAQRLQQAAIQAGQLLISTVGNILSAQKQAEAQYQNQIRALNKQYERDMEEARRFTGEQSRRMGREALQKLQDGMREAVKTKEFDPMSLIKVAIPAIIQIALSTQPATAPYAALVGSAVALMLNEMHEGGWVGNAPPSMRERPALLLDGERVLSHAEVSNMGGPSAVDDSARGRPGRGGGGSVIQLTVNTVDAASFRRYLDEDGGRGLARSLAGGRGEAAQLIRRMARR